MLELGLFLAGFGVGIFASTFIKYDDGSENLSKSIVELKRVAEQRISDGLVDEYRSDSKALQDAMRAITINGDSVSRYQAIAALNKTKHPI